MGTQTQLTRSLDEPSSMVALCNSDAAPGFAEVCELLENTDFSLSA